MASYAEIFELEKQREKPDQWNVIHLLKEGTMYHANEWSAWLAREFATTEEQRTAMNIKPLTPVHREVKNTSGSLIFVGVPFASLDKFIPPSVQLSFTAISDTRIDIVIELPETLGELDYEKLLQMYHEWKQQWPVKKPSGKKDGSAPGSSHTGDPVEFLLTGGSRQQPMRMSDILGQIIALPVEDITPNDALKILRILKQQCSALF